MIELLMVIILVGVLSAVALPQFLDFRKEGKASALRQSLNSLRVAYKNQTQQAVLRCGISKPSTWTSPLFRSFYQSMYFNYTGGNDITYCNTTGSGTTWGLCTVAQIPDPADRKFLSVSDSERAHRFTNNGATDMGPVGFFPKNQLLNPSDFFTAYEATITTNAELAARGGPCGLSDFYKASPYFWGHNWIFNTDSGEIWAGTNTAGLNECNW